MNFNNFFICLACLVYESSSHSTNLDNMPRSKVINDHKVITNTNVYPYVVAVLKKSSLLSTGALISDQWVITAADSLYLLKDGTRLIHVRLGSVNYKKGGHLCPVKYVEIHPKFDDESPEFDVALLRLAKIIQYSVQINPIRMLTTPQDIISTHFLVTYWNTFYEKDIMEPIYRVIERRHLQIAQLHPSDDLTCNISLQSDDMKSNRNVMCLDVPDRDDPCKRETGGPVVLNRLLWGIVSSWIPPDCDTRLPTPPIYATKLFGIDILTWIHAVMTGETWDPKLRRNHSTVEDYYD